MSTYTIQSGDDLSKIAQKVYGNSSDANGQKIFEANKTVIGNDPTQLRPGQVLNIP
jgi:nucleoid-associated protein YgaU